MNTSKDIALTIERLFNESGYGKYYFCELCDMRNVTFDNMVKGKHVPQLEKIVTMLDVLGYELNIEEVE